MNSDPQITTALCGVSDLDLFRETASRLSRRYEQEHKVRFLFGSFDFIFHGGTLRCIEERPRNKRFFKEDSVDRVLIQGGGR